MSDFKQCNHCSNEAKSISMIRCHCGDPAEFINTDNGCKADRIHVCSSCLFWEPDLMPLRLVANATNDVKTINAVKWAVIEILLNTGSIQRIKEY